MAQVLYDKHRPSGLLLALAAGGMLIFLQYLREALHKFSGIKMTGLIAGWAFLIFLMVHGPAARIVSEHSSFRPFAEKVKKVSKNRPLLNYGKAREDLRYYLDLPVKDVFGGSAFQELISQPETMMIIKKSHSKAWLEKSSDLKIIVEMDLSFEPYQLVGKP